jgi:hypothetical protein
LNKIGHKKKKKKKKKKRKKKKRKLQLNGQSRAYMKWAGRRPISHEHMLKIPSNLLAA